MATMVAINRYQQPIFNRKNRDTTMKRDLTPIIEKIRELQQLTERTGFRTTRSVGALLGDLSADELVEVNKALSNPSHKLFNK
jgi:hypothetical protein